MAEDTETVETQAADTGSKKRSFVSRTMDTSDAQSALAFVVTLAFIFIIVLVIFHPPADPQAATIFTLIGSLATLAGMVGSYYFGSSKGSTAKDEGQARTLSTLVNKVTENGDHK
jgi:hypothetical protein